MSGHSKWSTIKRQKATTDKKRGLIFTKLANAITLSVREGGGITDPTMNFRLRLSIEKARGANMPKDNIERAIGHGAGSGKDAVIFSELLYEGFGPGGIMILVEVVTDNKNRTQGLVRGVFERNGGRLASSGAVVHQFLRLGILSVAKREPFDTMLGVALDVGARDVKESLDQFTFYTEPSDLHRIKEKLEEKGTLVIENLLGYIPNNVVTPVQTDEALIIALLEALEDLNDVQEVYTNAGFLQ